MLQAERRRAVVNEGTVTGGGAERDGSVDGSVDGQRLPGDLRRRAGQRGDGVVLAPGRSAPGLHDQL